VTLSPSNSDNKSVTEFKASTNKKGDTQFNSDKKYTDKQDELYVQDSAHDSSIIQLQGTLSGEMKTKKFKGDQTSPFNKPKEQRVS
jgi:hypothetical protein